MVTFFWYVPHHACASLPQRLFLCMRPIVLVCFIWLFVCMPRRLLRTHYRSCVWFGVECSTRDRSCVRFGVECIAWILYWHGSCSHLRAFCCMRTTFCVCVRQVFFALTFVTKASAILRLQVLWLKSVCALWRQIYSFTCTQDKRRQLLSCNCDWECSSCGAFWTATRRCTDCTCYLSPALFGRAHAPTAADYSCCVAQLLTTAAVSHLRGQLQFCGALATTADTSAVSCVAFGFESCGIHV